MPIIFVHGVANRREDPTFARSQAIRGRMVEQIIAPAFPQFPNMGNLREVYWGDLGVKFLWDQKSLPKQITFESTIASEAPELVETTHSPRSTSSAETLENAARASSASFRLSPIDAALASFLASQSSPITRARTESLESAAVAPKSALLEASQKNPRDLIDACLEPLLAELSRSDAREASRELPVSIRNAEMQGRQVADLLLAADAAKSDVAFLESLKNSQTDREVLKKLETRLGSNIAPTRSAIGLESVSASESVADVWTWLQDRVTQISQWIGDGVSGASNAISDPGRAATVLLLQRYREQISKAGFIFLGDVFEYLRRGQGKTGSISQSVRKQIAELAQANRKPGEPLVVISHSFGGEIVYDLLTTDRLADLPIDLWVTVGSQVGLFAEMMMYEASTQNKPAGGHISKPESAKKWINVYDPADVFSFLCEPIFGTSVSDIRNTGGNAFTAHSDYLTRPDFYREILHHLAS